MTFMEFDAEVRLMISSTIGNCGGTPAPDAVDSCATGIEALACKNIGALEEQNADQLRKAYASQNRLRA